MTGGVTSCPKRFFGAAVRLWYMRRGKILTRRNITRRLLAFITALELGQCLLRVRDRSPWQRSIMRVQSCLNFSAGG